MVGPIRRDRLYSVDTAWDGLWTLLCMTEDYLQRGSSIKRAVVSDDDEIKGIPTRREVCSAFNQPRGSFVDGKEIDLILTLRSSHLPSLAVRPVDFFHTCCVHLQQISYYLECTLEAHGLAEVYREYSDTAEYFE